ncbi:hypothetical protein FRC01_004840 [Tulasnella sp. 417]|nr:hypothetical protein FRC01_004840 [Tulasnella sp. 417]
MATPESPLLGQRQLLQSLSTFRIERTRIKPLEADSESLGAGGNADVIRARLEPAECSTLGPDETPHVAVKKMRVDDDTGDIPALTMLAHEVHLLSTLSSPNIIKIIGFVEDVENGIAWIVLPWEKNGNLQEFIQSAKWELPELISLIYDAISGISYLHSREPPVCHGDLKSLNILVTAKNRAIITDLGSARSLDCVREPTQRILPNPARGTAHEDPKLRADIAASGASITLTGPAWTLRWAAPELLDGCLPSLASDIWAFGWICWEVLTGNLPFHEENDMSTIRRIVEGELPTVVGDVRLNQITALANLMTDCWTLYPNKRPTAKKCEREVYWMDHSPPGSSDENASFEARSPWLSFSLACVHMAQDKLGDAEAEFHRSADAACSRKNHKALAYAVRGLGRVYYQRGESFKAERAFVCTQYILSQIGDQSGLAYTVKALGEVFLRRGEIHKAEELSVAAFDIFSRVGDQNGFAWAAKALGDVYHLQGEWPKALEFYITARNGFSQIENQLGLANTMNGLGNTHRLQGRYPEAEESYFTARDICARIGNQAGTAYALLGLGAVDRLRGEHSKAEELCTAARDIYSQFEDQHGLAGALNGLGDVYVMQEEYAKAEGSYIAARDIYTRFMDRNGLEKALKGLGDVYRLRGKSPEAEESYIASKDIRAVQDEKNDAKTRGKRWRKRRRKRRKNGVFAKMRFGTQTPKRVFAKQKRRENRTKLGHTSG